MVAEATTAGRIVRRTRKASKRGDDPDPESSAMEDSDLLKQTRPRPPFSKPNTKTSSTKKKGDKTKAKPSSDCGLNESSDFFADDESGNETPGSTEFSPGPGPIEFDTPPGAGPVEFIPSPGPDAGPIEFNFGPLEFNHSPPLKMIEPEPVSQPEVEPDTAPNYDDWPGWPNKPLFPPEHYDNWIFPEFPDPQENIFSIYREFLLPSPLAFLRNIHLRTDRGLVDLDLIDPCVPESPCLLDRMAYRDGVCHTCYDYQRLRNFRGYYQSSGYYNY